MKTAERLKEILKEKAEQGYLMPPFIPIAISIFCNRMDRNDTSFDDDYQKYIFDQPLNGLWLLQVINCSQKRLLTRITGKILTLVKVEIENLKYGSRIGLDLLSRLEEFADNSISQTEFEKESLILANRITYYMDSKYYENPIDRCIATALIQCSSLQMYNVGLSLVNVMAVYRKEDLFYKFKICQKLKGILELHTTAAMFHI